MNTSGTLNDIDDEMLEFLSYVKKSTDEIADNAKSDLVKVINQKVNHVKHDKTMEVEYMTLLERDRLNFVEGKEEGREEGRKEGRTEEKIQMARKLLLRGMSIDEVASITELAREKVASLIE